MDKSIKKYKVFENHPIALGVEERGKACRKKPKEKGFKGTEKKVYRPQIPSTHKETELSQNLNDGMDWVFRDY